MCIELYLFSEKLFYIRSTNYRKMSLILYIALSPSSSHTSRYIYVVASEYRCRCVFLHDTKIVTSRSQQCFCCLRNCVTVDATAVAAAAEAI